MPLWQELATIPLRACGRGGLGDFMPEVGAERLPSTESGIHTETDSQRRSAMPKIILSFCLIFAVAFGASLSASPITAPVVSPTLAATSCTPPPVALATPSRGLQAPVWLSSGDCWTTFDQCAQQCENHEWNPQNPCWLACDCAYCVCESIMCVQECNGLTS